MDSPALLPELPTSAAARFLEVDPRTLKRWTANGRIRCRRTAAGRRVYALSDLDALRRGSAS